jgi:hypothetical protein
MRSWDAPASILTVGVIRLASARQIRAGCSMPVPYPASTTPGSCERPSYTVAANYLIIPLHRGHYRETMLRFKTKIICPKRTSPRPIVGKNPLPPEKQPPSLRCLNPRPGGAGGGTIVTADGYRRGFTLSLCTLYIASTTPAATAIWKRICVMSLVFLIHWVLSIFLGTTMVSPGPSRWLMKPPKDHWLYSLSQ